jgi:histidinol dehydrogenase
MKIYPYPSTEAEDRVSAIAGRGIAYTKKAHADVTRILEDVRKNGDDALIRYTNTHDAPGLGIETLKVSPDEIKRAEKAVDRSFIRSLNRAVRQIEAFHRKQVQNSWMTADRPGTLLGQLVRPVDRVGAYVPGGKGGSTPLVSSVLMGAIPAKIAGVGHITMATPPTRDGSVNPHLLVAAKKAGVNEIVKVGSAWAIGALAYGTESVPKVDVIVGPGNMWVTLAKKIVSGTVGIDMIAGPSEVLVIADETADPAYTAADLLSQAEHDPLASAVLVTTSKPIAEAVRLEIDRQLSLLPRREIAEKSLADFGAILVTADIDAAIDLANRFAPEHLELHIDAPFDHVGKIRHAGAVFMGHHTPEPVGDYIAGPNHVLPTAGTARFASALSVDHFIKKTSLIYYSREAFEKDAPHIMRLAEIEGLSAHARSVKVRMEKK